MKKSRFGELQFVAILKGGEARVRVAQDAGSGGMSGLARPGPAEVCQTPTSWPLA